MRIAKLEREITLLQKALVAYGDRGRMSNAANSAIQQAIDRAFENAGN